MQRTPRGSKMAELPRQPAVRQRPLNPSGGKQPKHEQHNEDDYENEKEDARDIGTRGRYTREAKNGRKN
jgi:hypothetical protein